MSKKHRAPEPQPWDPRTPQWATPPPGTWPGPPQGSPPSQPLRQDSTAPPPRKRRRVFLWVFLAVQILFLIWVILGASTASGTPEGCRGLTGEDLKLCEDASDVGTTIGVGLIVAFWVAADFILALTYAIYRLASRQPRT